MKNIALGIFMVMFLASCSKHEAGSDFSRYGEIDSASFKVCYSLLPEFTKMAQVNEILVENVNLYLFNELNDLVYYSYSDGSANVELNVYKNMNYSVYAVVNAGRELHVTKLDEIKELSYGVEEYADMVSANGGVLMAGKLEGVKLSDVKTITIDVTRCVAKVILKCDYSLLKSDVDIKINSVELKNMPLSVSPFSTSKLISGSSTASYLVENLSASQLESGVTFYQYENMQGLLQPGNLDQTKKWWPAESPYSKLCSYVELKGYYSSPRKEGDIIYRFFLGKDMVADYSVERNRQYTITLNFKGDGAVEENSWRVDNSEIIDLVTSVTLSPLSHKFTTLGATLQLSASLLPITANNKNLTWSSSNSSVASVTQTGEVTAVGDGDCIITATSCDGTNISATCNISVDSKVYVTGISVEPTALALYVGESGTISATITPSNATAKGVSWSSSNSRVATVDENGKVMAVSAGVADIIAKSSDDPSKQAICKVTVSSNEFSISPLEQTLYVGESFTISYKTTPQVTAQFASESSTVATVDVSGKVTANSAGSTRIKVSAHGKELYCTLTVVNPQIAFPESGRVMYDGERVTIPYSILLPSTSDVSLSLSNSNLKIVSNDSKGVTIEALTPGTCKLTAQLGPVSATYDVTIEKLRIVPKVTSFVIFDHFDYSLGYDIYPSHASSLGAEVTLSSRAAQFVYFPTTSATQLRVSSTKNPNGNRTLPSDSEQLSLTLSVKGRSDASSTVNFTIDQISMVSNLNVPVNFKYGSITHNTNLNIVAPQAAKQQFKERANDITLDAIGHGWVDENPPLGVTFSFAGSGSIPTVTSCSSNGNFTMRLKCLGADSEALTFDIVVTLHEVVYLVGIEESRTISSEADGNPNMCNGYSEICGRWFTSPSSFYFINNMPELAGIEITVPIPYRYKTNQTSYTYPNTGVTEEIAPFEFTYGGYLLDLTSGEQEQFNVSPWDLYRYKSVALDFAAGTTEESKFTQIDLNSGTLYIYPIIVVNFGSLPYFSLRGVFDWVSVYNRSFVVL